MLERHYDVGVAVFVTITFIMGLFALNCMITFYKLWTRNIKIVTSRKPKSLFVFGVLNTIALLVHDPLVIFTSQYPTFFQNTYIIHNFTQNIFVVGSLYILLYRIWMVYFDVKFIRALEDEQWQTQIDTKTLKKSWFIHNRQKYGKPKFVGVFLFIMWFVGAFCSTLMVFIYGRSVQSLFFVLFGVLFNLIALLVLSCVMPKFNDIYYLRIHTERMSKYAAIIVLIIFIMVFILKGSPGQWAWLLGKFSNELLAFCEVIGSFYFLKTFRLPIFYCSVSNSLAVDQLVENSTNYNSNSNPNSRPHSDDHLKLSDILSRDEPFRLFAKQLTKQFAIENLLFFVETQQFIQYVGNQLYGSNVTESLDESDDSSTSLRLVNNIICTPTVPQSTIVKDLADNESNENIKYITGAINLFSKYIEKESYFEINISYETRENLYNKFGYLSGDMKDFMIQNNITLKEMYFIFDEARIEVLRLLTSVQVIQLITK